MKRLRKIPSGETRRQWSLFQPMFPGCSIIAILEKRLTKTRIFKAGGSAKIVQVLALYQIAR